MCLLLAKQDHHDGRSDERMRKSMGLGLLKILPDRLRQFHLHREHITNSTEKKLLESQQSLKSNVT